MRAARCRQETASSIVNSLAQRHSPGSVHAGHRSVARIRRSGAPPARARRVRAHRRRRRSAPLGQRTRLAAARPARPARCAAHRPHRRLEGQGFDGRDRGVGPARRRGAHLPDDLARPAPGARAHRHRRRAYRLRPLRRPDGPPAGGGGHGRLVILRVDHGPRLARRRGGRLRLAGRRGRSRRPARHDQHTRLQGGSGHHAD